MTKRKHVPHSGPSGATCWGIPHCVGSAPFECCHNPTACASTACDEYIESRIPREDQGAHPDGTTTDQVL